MDMTAEEFIRQLVTDGITQKPWVDATFESDFILLSEFSELEGPKPIFTIPSHMSTNFNLNTFAVRIMSVDCVSIMQTTDFSTLNIAGDIQVVLTEVSEGAVAFVYHFVLYDIRARGFVRPFCLAYITRNYGDLMDVFDELLQFFSTVASLYHFGNGLSFINDLMLRIQHLQHLKNVVNDKTFDIFVDDKVLPESQKESITQQTLDDAIVQMHKLAETFKAYVNKEDFSQFRGSFRERYNEILTGIDSIVSDREKFNCPHFYVENDSCLEEHVNTCGDQGLSLNDTSFAVEEESVLVQLISSQSISPKEYQINDCDLSDSEDGVILSARPSHKVPADVMSSILGKKYDKPLRNLAELCTKTFNPGWNMLNFCLHYISNNRNYNPSNFCANMKEENPLCNLRFGCYEFPVLPSLSSDCCHEKQSNGDSLQIKRLLAYFTESDESQDRVFTPQEDIVFDSIRNSFLSTMKCTALSSPVLKPAQSSFTEIDINVRDSNILSIEQNGKEGYFMVDSPELLGNMFGQTSGSEGSLDSFQDALESLPASSKSSTIGSSSGIVTYSRAVSVLSTDSHSSLDSDVYRVLKTSLLTLRNSYSFLPHAVFSLLIGRPLIVIGEESHMKRVKNLVYGLGNFFPQHQPSTLKSIPWMSNPLRLSDIGTVLLAGMVKAKDTKTVPKSILPYVSVLDFENQVLQAPEYFGGILTDIFNPEKDFFSEVAYRRFVQQVLRELCNKAYTLFTTSSLLPNQLNLHLASLSSRDTRSNGRTLSGDYLIVLELVNRLRQQVMTMACNEHGYESAFPAQPIRLNHLKCKTFKNAYNKKKR